MPEESQSRTSSTFDRIQFAQAYYDGQWSPEFLVDISRLELVLVKPRKQNSTTSMLWPIKGTRERNYCLIERLQLNQRMTCEPCPGLSKNIATSDGLCCDDCYLSYKLPLICHISKKVYNHWYSHLDQHRSFHIRPKPVLVPC